MTESLILRDATADDLPVIIALLADDKLGSTREDPEDLAPYLAAFAELEADRNQRLIVAERGAEIVGTFQLSFIPGVSQRGLKRAMIESVRVAAAERGSGLGTQMMRWAIDEARQAGCGQVQLTSNAERSDAHRFYERLGFVPSHVGFKLKLG
jgi:GNAT superfamily N-acetyltransferase